MGFINFRDAVISHFDEMQKKYNNLFVVELDKDKFYKGCRSRERGAYRRERASFQGK